MSRELIKVSTYARMNNISVQAVYKKVHKGELKVETIDGIYFIVKEEYGKNN